MLSLDNGVFIGRNVDRIAVAPQCFILRLI